MFCNYICVSDNRQPVSQLYIYIYIDNALSTSCSNLLFKLLITTADLCHTLQVSKYVDICLSLFKQRIFHAQRQLKQAPKKISTEALDITRRESH